MESQFLRSLFFALILFVLVSALGSIKYPAVQRLEGIHRFCPDDGFRFHRPYLFISVFGGLSPGNSISSASGQTPPPPPLKGSP